MPEIPTAWIAIPAILALIGFIFWFGNWHGAVNSDRAKFAKFIDEIRGDIKKILGRLPPTPVSGTSPLQLTDIGEDISRRLKARDWAQRIAPTLTEKVAGKLPFEVQDFCFEYVKKTFEPTDDQDKELRMAAYEHGLTKDLVLDVLVVELRDRLLESAGLESPD